MTHEIALQNLLIREYGLTEQEAAESSRALIGMVELLVEINQRNKQKEYERSRSKDNKSKA